MMRRIKAACVAAAKLVNFTLSDDLKVADAADTTIIGAAALHRFTMNRLIQMGQIEAVMNMQAVECSVYQFLVDTEKEQIKAAHERKVQREQQKDTFPQAAGRA